MGVRMVGICRSFVLGLGLLVCLGIGKGKESKSIPPS